MKKDLMSQRGALPIVAAIIGVVVLVAGGWLILKNPPEENLSSEPIAPGESGLIIEEVKEEPASSVADEPKEEPIKTTQEKTGEQPKTQTPLPKPKVAETSTQPEPVSTTSESLSVEPASTTEEAEESVLEEQNYTVKYTPSGFEPKVLTIKLKECASGGYNCAENKTTITFINEVHGGLMWVASDPHPNHTDHRDFDQRTGISFGGKYEYTFPKQKGSYGYHNHLSGPPLHTATIVFE